MFKCLRPLRALLALDDVADLDADLIVLLAVAEELASAKDEAGAKMKLAAARELLSSLKSGAQAGAPTIQMGLGSKSPRTKATVRVS
jgi:hypothetical protein